VLQLKIVIEEEKDIIMDNFRRERIIRVMRIMDSVVICMVVVEYKYQEKIIHK
jgi:hypothetical protein